MADRFVQMHALLAAGGIFTILETVAVVNFLKVNSKIDSDQWNINNHEVNGEQR